MRRLGRDGGSFDPRHLQWFGKWSSPESDFTINFFGEQCFSSTAAARAAWPAARRALWAQHHRFGVPQPATVYDGITVDSCDAARWPWNHPTYPLDDVLRVLAADRAHLAGFRTRDPKGAASIGDYLDLLEADLAVIEQAARALGAARQSTRSYPAHLSTAATYDGRNGPPEDSTPELM